MAKRQFVMLAHTLDDEDTKNLAGWFVSTKLDGLRMFWDGGISRGMPVEDVPYANIQRDGRFVDSYVSTGLWSRNAKVIRAPGWFLDKLPKIPLDGEVFGGEGKWELTSSIVRRNNPSDDDWQQITYQIFDCPPFHKIFGDGTVETEIFTKKFKDIDKWAMSRAISMGIATGPSSSNQIFEYCHKWLKNQNIENDYVRILDQTMIPHTFDFNQQQAMIEEKMKVVLANKGEGLMARSGYSFWEPERCHSLLKIKKWNDDEAIVAYYVWGRKTKKGSKHLGRMGTMGVVWKDKMFEISGFKDTERLVTDKNNSANCNIFGAANAGMKMPDNWLNPLFPIGSKITFRYRELTAIGIPKNGQYMRKPSDL